MPYANLTNPQTLNLYAMGSDNPETFADLDGHCSMDQEVCDTNPSNGETANQASTNKNVCNNETGKCDNANANVNGHDQDNVQKTAQQQSYTYTDAADNLVVLQQKSTTTTTSANGNVTTMETSTTLRFSTASGHEGDFVSGDRTTTMTVRDSHGNVVDGGSEHARFGAGDAEAARAAVGGAAFAQGRSAAIPSAATRFMNRHVDARAGTRDLLIDGVLAYTPVPEGYEGLKLAIEIAAAVHTIYDTIH